MPMPLTTSCRNHNQVPRRATLLFLLLALGLTPAVKAGPTLYMYFINGTPAGDDTITTTYIINWTKQTSTSYPPGGGLGLRNRAGDQFTSFIVDNNPVVLGGTITNPGFSNWGGTNGSWAGQTVDFSVSKPPTTSPGYYFSVSGGDIFQTVRVDLPAGSTVPPLQHYDQTYTYTVAFTDPTNVSDNYTKRCDPNTGCHGTSPMAQYSIHLLPASLHVEDTPVSYNSPRGPATDFTVIYNQREANQPLPFPFCNFGPRWTFIWLSYVTDDPNNATANADIYARGGGTENYLGFDTGTQTFAPDPQSLALLVRTSNSSYEKRMPDGSKEVYSLPDGSSSFPRRIFLTSVVDAAGNATSITYDSAFRITSITDSLGQSTTCSYDLPGDPLKITKITDPFGRFATFEYTNGQLTKITDPIGIQSQFQYETNSDFMTAMTTPYGTTNFTREAPGTSPRWIEATDPLGGKEHVEYRDYAPGIYSSDPSNAVPNGFANSDLDAGNSFYWNKKAMADAPGDYTKALMIHWLKSADGTAILGIRHSEKAALENRVWYKYANQADGSRLGSSASPIQIARVLDDGTTQLTQLEYNSIGNLTKETDPTGRVFSYVYTSNGIDLLEKRQTRGANNELLQSFTYNSGIPHLPDTATDAARETTSYTYNSYGQLRTVTNAKNEATTYTYDRDQNGDGVTDGYVLSVTGPVSGATTTYHYDNSERVDSVTDSDGYVVGFVYDNIDRPTSMTYPDSTSKQFKYTKYVNGADTGIMTLDLGAIKDRRGRWTYREYNANRQLTKVTDPLGRNTLFDWCSCGSLGSITDGNNRVTTFVRDVQGRVTSKVFADTKSILYTYETTTSRLKSMTDAKSQVMNYQYFIDNDLKQISYTNISGQPLSPPTPTVASTYDPNYNRIATMVDGTGTTTYTYNPITGSVSPGAGQLHSVDGPLANDTIVHTHDELGRQLSASVNGVAASQTYDSLGRIGTATNPLGVFTNTYLSVSPRLQNIALPNGQSVIYGYFPNSADKRLQTIQNKTSAGAIVSKFDYQYDPDGEMTSLTRQLGATGFPMVWANGANSMGDAADQLTTVVEQKSATQYGQYSYAYDGAGNRTSDNGGPHTFNNVNQVTDAGYAYDNNGNYTSDPWATYEWDAANRLRAINYNVDGGRTEFTYDGLGRRVKIVEKSLPAPAINFNVQPPNTSYGTYTSATVSLTTDTYKLTITGLNPNGGTNTALIDAVKRNTLLVWNGGFEAPVLAAGAATYAPAGATWSFIGTSGIAKNNSGVTFANPVAPEGTQVGFVLNTASLWQYINLGAGSYNINLRAAQRGTTNTSFQRLNVKLQGVTLVVTSTKQFVWNGNSIAEERDANNTITRRFYPQGEQISGASYYYMRDHLGSVRELADSTGAVRARYDYDPYGYRTKLSGDLDAQFGYTGFYYHSRSGLNLALYRAYDFLTGRWLSRDPIGERGGINLYAYVGNDPLDYVDQLGLWQVTIGAAYGYGFNLTFGHNNGQWNASAILGIGLGLAGGFNPNDKTVGHVSGDSVQLGVGAFGSLGEPQLVELSGGFDVSGQINKCGDYWGGTTFDGGIGNMYLGDISGSTWLGAAGNAGALTIHPSVGTSSNGWGWSGGALGVVGIKLGGTW